MPSPSAHTCMNGLVVSASACADSSSGMVVCIVKCSRRGLHTALRRVVGTGAWQSGADAGVATQAPLPA